MREGTRESAYVHAITAAGVAYVVTRTCSTGTLDRCGCDGSVGGVEGVGGVGGTTSPVPPGPRSSNRRQQKPDFEWAGCSDNIAYGTAFSRAFVDARERVSRNNGSNKALMNLHNNEAGRKVPTVLTPLSPNHNISPNPTITQSHCHPIITNPTHYHPTNTYIINISLATTQLHYSPTTTQLHYHPNYHPTQLSPNHHSGFSPNI